jgi:hypothetical protein
MSGGEIIVELGQKWYTWLQCQTKPVPRHEVMNGSVDAILSGEQGNDEITQLYPSGNLTKTDLSSLCKPDRRILYSDITFKDFKRSRWWQTRHLQVLIGPTTFSIALPERSIGCSCCWNSATAEL